MMAMSYGYVYVAQVAMGADQAQTLKAIREAEAYDGPSLVICYCPCIEHGMKRGMGLSQEAEKDAVQSGYWQLYRYNPDLAEQGKNPFQLDYSKEPNGEFQTFIKGQNRYASLKLSFPEKADGLYESIALKLTRNWLTTNRFVQRTFSNITSGWAVLTAHPNVSLLAIHGLFQYNTGR